MLFLMLTLRAGRKETKNATTESRLSTHFTVTFKTYDEKAEFLENIGINRDDVYITSDKFLKRLND